ncbi:MULTISPECIES: penicillin-binding transpeptidase domain-containing protein [Paenibacillus]|uniref:penicillin-binding transpeptidase domain-containing protein n=1 Tax=Paenibacillus TaxID=44249 RepID=UPI0004F702D3|nr:penicillin-binding transpeptidase domain-containing protein [Paenibacillus odorifer]AIQ75944.1 stage V sporulation protein D [Paenibacillus odorifer]MEC0132231.1 penicillin-binding transpeptidase domain-containing protein [Paenibacillus odorifer]MEC0223602.1 penicillin-binding transpeptidase domain-containing protein [Paenibacillus odorifer]OMD17898.1 stage V sporulation protein D [Paenibacillus odorifer]
MLKRIKLRTLFIGGCITLFFLVLIVRVFWIQVMQGEEWQEKAATLWAHTSTIKAERGTISDRNGSVLASDVPAYTVVVNPEVIQQQGIGEEVITGLHELLGKPEDELRKLVEAKDEKTGAYLKNREIRNEGWKIDQELADKVKEFYVALGKEHKIQETGIGLVREQKRYYPKDELAAHILGYTDRDGNAIMGLEKYFDTELKGADGKLLYQSDGQGVKLPDSQDTYKPVVNGSNFKLTIDSTIQHYIEEAMQKAYAQYKPKSMSVIAADPNTMEILGLANMPTYNPNEFWKTGAEGAGFYNHAIKSTYEPGSTFKIVTLAAAVEEKLFDPVATFLSGSIRIKGYSKALHDINHAGWGQISFLEGVKRSSNVLFVKLYEMLGQDKLLQYINDFGFNEKTGIDLPGEASGVVNPNVGRPIEIATLAYGHGKVLVTPLQQLVAVSAIANGGKLMTPYVVKEVTNPNTGETKVTEPSVVRQVIDEESAKKTGEYLEQVVADQVKGTGRNAYIDGYRVAGKTGTAIKVEGKDYVKSKVLVSFIGYAPVDDPKIAVIVIIDEPNVEVGGGKAAAPVFKEIVSQSLQYMGVPKLASEASDSSSKKPAKTETVALRTTPDLTDKTMKEAREALLDQGFDYVVVGEGSAVESQYPEAGTKLATGQRIYLLSPQGAQPTIPDLKGESLRDALEILTLLKVEIAVDGEGYVSEQIVGTQNGKTLVTLKMKPLNDYGEDIPVAPPADEGTDSESGT